MVFDANQADAPSATLMMLEGRALWEFGAFMASLPALQFTKRGDGHPVFVLPGLIQSDMSTRPLRAFLAHHGYRSYGWELGRNYGPRNGVEERMLERLRALRKQYGRKVSLIGWSLGGVYARELAKQAPDDVRLVITLGSPFQGNPKATNGWRLYELTSGRLVDDPLLHDPNRRIAPPVPVTAIYSRTDGVVAWQCCREEPGPFRENIEVHGSHCGLGHHPAAAYAIADRLAQPEGEWRQFDSSGVKRLFYPDPNRAVSV